jgi:site-specific recombinase XerD
MVTSDFTEARTYWRTSLIANGKRPETVRAYMAGTAAYASWASSQAADPDLTLISVEKWCAGMAEAGLSSGTITARLIAVRLFSKWLATREYTDRDELATVKPPKLENRVVESLTDAELSRLLDACTGRDFTAVRDRAIVRFHGRMRHPRR